MPTTRPEFQQLARLRIAEARALLRLGHHHGAYYLAGYAVECGLKACIARKFRRHELPDKEVVVASYTHDLQRLLKFAELEAVLDKERKRSARFSAHWGLVKDWTVESRYAIIDESRARDMLRAVVGRDSVMAWIRRYW